MSIEPFLNWVAAHPHWAGLIVFWVALAESLAFVGLIVPGVAMMFAAGALVGSGALAFTPICLWAVLGAIAGDGLSFWAGRRFQDHLKNTWPFSSHPGMIERGEQFFYRYGGRSVLLGRFVGPVRAVIPVVAGMLGMPLAQFFIINVISALLWAPLYLLPGMVFGASLDLAARVAGRLVILLLGLVAILWLTGWLSHRIYSFAQSRAYRFIQAVFDWNKQHPLMARLSGPILNPDQRDYASLVGFGVSLYLLAQALSGFTGSQHSLQSLRTPWADYLLSALAGYGAYPNIILLSLAVAALLLAGKRYAALAHWLIALGFCALATEAKLPGLPGLDGPLLRGGVVFGLLAVLIAGAIPPGTAWLAYSAASLLATSLLIARVYLAAASLSQALLTALIAMIWTTLVGIAYRRHMLARAPWKPLLGVTVLVLCLTGSAALWRYEEVLETPPPLQTISESVWWEQGWQALPAFRDAVFSHHRQPLNLQWRAEKPRIAQALRQAGWRPPVPLTLRSSLYWLNPQTLAAQLPLLPNFFHGEREQLILIRPLDSQRCLVLRLWSTATVLEPSGQPLWIGRIAVAERTAALGLLVFLDEVEEAPADFPASAQQIQAIAAANEGRSALRQTPNRRFPVLLIASDAH